MVPASITDRYLAVRPPLGDVTVVTIGGESPQRRLLAATLQGIVNRTSARIYLVGARNPAQDQFWLDDYLARGLVHVVAHDTLDDALSTFAGEASGYVLASYAEPWTINTATSVAAAQGALVATPDQAPLLDGLGLHELDDHIGRWPDAATAYEAVAAQVTSQLGYQGLAIQQPDANAPRDFYVQQGIMTVFTRPSQPDHARVMALLAPYPATHPVYGYVSDNGTEEVQAILELSQAGRFLVPTDTTDNLSFHLAVAAGRPRATLAPDRGGVATCDPAQVNVVVATSDGDNMVIPEAYLPSSDRWESSRRGTLPIGWGISPATAVLMPAVWDRYATTATDADEVVGLVGLGYSAPSLMPDPAAFLADSNRLSAVLGVETMWSLDLLLSRPDAAGWPAIAAAGDAVGWNPMGYLLNYQDFGGPAVFQGAGLPVFAAHSTDYNAGADALAAHLDTLLATPSDQRPIVNFFPATVWNSTYDSLATALLPYVDRGVRFLTPRQAFACLTTEVEPTSTTSTTPSSTTLESTTTASTSLTTSTEPATSSMPTLGSTNPATVPNPSSTISTTDSATDSATTDLPTGPSASPPSGLTPGIPGQPPSVGDEVEQLPARPVANQPTFVG